MNAVICDNANCQKRRTSEYETWYEVTDMGGIRFAGLTEGPWHFDTLDCLTDWAEGRKELIP